MDVLGTLRDCVTMFLSMKIIRVSKEVVLILLWGEYAECPFNKEVMCSQCAWKECLLCDLVVKCTSKVFGYEDS